MRAVVQRVVNACVSVDGRTVGKIDSGLLVYLGVEDSDNENICRKMADKIRRLRIFRDENDKMNLSVQDAGGSVLVVSQFTLYADLHKGNRPSFDSAGKPEHANSLYERFIEIMKEEGIHTEHGEFGADMMVSYTNCGPVTIIADSEDLFR